MELQIIEHENDVTYQVPQINFPRFAEYKTQAEQIAAYISSLPVSEDRIKECKTALAKARKLTDRLNRSRIDIKKEILSNYAGFEAQVKELCSIIDTADSELRQKVNKLEEIERAEKLSAIEELWDKRILQYEQIEKLIPTAFDLFFTPSYLNKSVSMKRIEDDMVDFMESTYNDIRTASEMGDDYLYEYSITGDLATAISNVKNREKWDEMRGKEEEDDEIPVQVFIVHGEKDIKLTEMLLKENQIDYRKGN